MRRLKSWGTHVLISLSGVFLGLDLGVDNLVSALLLNQFFGALGFLAAVVIWRES